MHILEVILRRINRFTEWTGKSFAWLVLPLIAVIVYDVFARYLFNAPTIWSFDVAWMMGTCLFMVGLSYVHLHKDDIKVEFLGKYFPPKVMLIFHLFFRIIFFLPLVVIYLKVSIDKAIWSFGINESYVFGIWHPTMIPYRIILVIAFFVLALEGISQFVRELLTVIVRRKL